MEAAVTVEGEIAPVLHRQMPAEELKQRILAERQRTMDYLKENLR